jgi:hypothetical protein
VSDDNMGTNGALPKDPDAQEPRQEPQAPEAAQEADAREPAIDQPGKLLRIAMMVREMLEEVRRAPLDVDARERLALIHHRVVAELKTGLSGPLAEELDRITSPFGDEEVPTEAELRIAQAQLLGWLEGLFQGIQAAIATQQMSMAAQLEEMRRRSLPPGVGPQHPGDNPGQYL